MVERYEEKDFFSVREGVIIWEGYFYSGGDKFWKILEYSGFETPVKEFVTRFQNDCILAYEDGGESCNQYIGEYSSEEAEKELKEWLAGTTPIDLRTIGEDLPDGHYVQMPDA